MENEEFYIATRDDGDKSKFVVYCSDKYKLEELDIINLIKLLIVDRRGIKLGTKIMDIYKDSTENRKKDVDEILKKIGVKNGDDKPTRATQSKLR